MARSTSRRHSVASEKLVPESISATAVLDMPDAPDDLVLTNLEPVGGSTTASGAFATHRVNARNGLHLRAGPGTEFPILRSLPLDMLVGVLKRNGDWVLIDTIGDGAADGFVHVEFLVDLSTAPTVERLTGVESDFIPLDAGLLQIIMDRCAGMRIRSSLGLNVVAQALNDAMIAAKAHTRLREIAFLSQSVIETDFFRTFEEYGKGKGKKYRPYYGRGMHQLTWKETYAACSAAIFGDDRLVRDPDLIIKDIDVNIQATAWYWRDYKPFNRLADAQDIDEIIRRLYGGTIRNRDPKVRDSVRRRRGYYETIKTVLKQRADSLI
jgi:putative chitinase